MPIHLPKRAVLMEVKGTVTENEYRDLIQFEFEPQENNISRYTIIYTNDLNAIPY